MIINSHKLFFYYRYGYALYLAQVFAAINTMILVYYTAGQHLDFIHNAFPNFALFVITAMVVGIPLMILIGFLHYKRAYKNEAEVITENNPYQYKLPPGHALEVTYPIYLEMLQFLKVLNPTDRERVKRLEELENKLKTLLEGGKVGL